MAETFPGESKDFSASSEMPDINEEALTMYSMRFCPYAERTRLVLNLKHVPYDVINIDLKDKPAWFLQRNPLGRVPTIEEKGRKPLFESLIVAEYLDDRFGGDMKLLPADLHDRALQKMTVEIVSQNVIMAFRGILYGGQGSDSLVKGLEEVDEMLTSEYFSGRSIGFADLMVWPWFERLEAIGHVYSDVFTYQAENYPNVSAWIARMLSNPDVKATTHSKEDFIAFTKSHRAGKMNGNIGLPCCSIPA